MAAFSEAWFAAWVLFMLWIAARTSHRLFQGADPDLGWRRAVILLGVGLTGAAVAISSLSRRENGDRFDYLGVYLRNGDSAFTVGAGPVKADIHLEPPASDVDAWRVTFLPTVEGHRITRVEGATWIEGRPPSAGHFTPQSTLLWGHELSVGHPIMLGGPAGAEAELEVVPDGPLGVALRIGPDTLHLDRRDVLQPFKRHALTARLKASLASGLVLRDFPPAHRLQSPLGQHLILTLVPAPPAYRWTRRPTLRVGWLDDREPAPEDSATVIVDSLTTIRILNGQRAWRFRLAEEAGPTGRRGVRLYFQGRPDSALATLPGSAACPAGVACGIVTNRSVPPPVAYLSLGHAGLDTARYDLLARLERTEGRATLVRLNRRGGAAPRSIPLVLGAATDLPLEPIGTASEAGAIVRLRNVSQLGVLWTDQLSRVVAVLLLWVAAAFTLLRREPIRWVVGFPGTSAVPFEETQERRNATAMFWSLLYATITLSSVRLVLGFRATMAEPFSPRGDVTALGLWIALPLAALMIGFTPLLMRWLGSLTLRSFGDWLRGTSGHFRPSLGLLGTLLAAGGGLLLFSSSFEVLQFAIAASLPVWLIALLAPIAFPFRHEASDTSGERRTGSPPGPVSMIVLGGMFAAVQASLLPPRVSAVAWGVIGLVVIAVRLVGAGGARRAWLAYLALWTIGPLFRFLNVGPVPVFTGILLILYQASRTRVQGHFTLPQAGRTDPATAAAPRIAAIPQDLLDQVQTIMVPLLPVAVYALLDFGLGLMCALPLLLTAVLGADIGRSFRATALGLLVAMGIVGAIAKPVLIPDHTALDAARTPVEVARALEELGGPLGRVARWTPLESLGLEEMIARPIIRSLAARDPEGLERALAEAGPSAYRGEIVRSLEQAWGGRAFTALGWTGIGLGNAPITGQGIPRPTAPAENTFAAFITAEHGALGGIAVLMAYLYLLVAALAWLLQSGAATDERHLTTRAMITGGALLLALPAGYVAVSNIGAVPLTGQNMPFLGLNAWSDVVLVTGVVNAMLFALAGLMPAPINPAAAEAPR